MADKKSKVEWVMMPLAVALVGTLGTYFITRQQNISSQRLAKLEMELAREQATADRQIKILEIFAEKITGSDQDRILALRMLKVVDGELAESLAMAVTDESTASAAVRKVAAEVAVDAAARAAHKPRVFIHIRDDEDRQAARELGRKLAQAGYLAPGVERLYDFGPAESQLRYFRKTEESQAKEIHTLLRDWNVQVALQYVPGYEKSENVKPMLFELWFVKGEPVLSP